MRCNMTESRCSSSCPAKRGRGTALRSSAVEGVSAVKQILFIARPLHHAAHGPPPPHWVRGRISNTVLATLCAPEVCKPLREAKRRSNPASVAEHLEG